MPENSTAWSQSELLRLLDKQHQSLSDTPYSIQLRLSLAESYDALGYPDLAACESYRAILLIDEVLDDSGEYHELALEVATEELGQSQSQVESTVRSVSLPSAYIQLIKSLVSCGCLRSAQEYSTRALGQCKDNAELLKLQDVIDTAFSQFSKRNGISNDQDGHDLERFPDKTLVRRDLYPWNTFEPDRLSDGFLEELNEQLGKVGNQIEARISELPLLSEKETSSEGAMDPHPIKIDTIKQLGLFAKQDIKPGQTILDEKSLLTASSVLHGEFCDACSIRLPDLASASGINAVTSSLQPVACDECDDAVFCSQECLALADASYHPALCGRDVEGIAKDVPAAEASDSLYSLLLLRALALAEAQNVHPLELKEVKFIWGDYSKNQRDQPAKEYAEYERTLPFSFKHNVLVPLHMLEKMDINIFETSSRYDFWVFNTLYAKFRGTASARQGPNGRPEVGAVHPLWCLANHSCDPTVTWDWQGSIKFWVKEERVLWKGTGSRKDPGLRKDEEVLSHYCDVDLPVQERREWAMGALGGICLCERCCWEAQLADSQ